MILHLSDWDHYPSAIVHWKTRNESFARMAGIYQSMGVKNFYFHLALINPLLEDVDPHDPDLTVEQMVMIQMECRENPWYFFREVLRIPPQAGDTPVQLTANRGNLALMWLFFNHVDVALIQPRQTGKSVSTDSIMIYIVMIAATNQTVNLLTKDDDLRKKNVERIKRMIKLLPKYLDYRTKEDADNKEEITCKAHGNHYMTAIGQNNEIAAGNLGRGLTSAVKHVDEGPFMNFMKSVIGALLGSGNAARAEAKRVGGFYGNIFTTTAGKKDTPSGAYMYDMIFGGMGWTESLYDAGSEERLHEIVKHGSPGLKPMVNCTFSHRQLGYTDEYMAEVIRTNNLSGEEADRDAFNRWTSGSLSSPISTALAEVIKNSERDPDYVEITREGYTLNWYIPMTELAERMAARKYILGMDTSEVIGRDSITVVIVDSETMEVVGAAACNETNIIRYCNFVADLMIKYENIVLIPERKSSAFTLLDALAIALPAKGIDPFRRVYSRIVDNHLEMETEYRLICGDVGRRNPQMYEKFKKYFGFNTSGSGQHSRNALYSDTLQVATRRGGSKVHDRRLSEEIRGLETRNGRIDHSVNGHDDMVIGWLLAVWMLTMSKNLSHYGITRALVNAPEYNGTRVKPKDDYAVFLEEEQRQLRDQLETLIETLKETKDELKSMKIENAIRNIDARLLERGSDDTSIDNLINDAKLSRVKSMRQREVRPIDRYIAQQRRPAGEFYHA